MKARRKFKITVEDVSRLETLATRSLSPAALAGLALALIFFSIVIGGLLVAFTPLRELVPGFMRDSRRAATEEAIMRVDSLKEASLHNDAYLANILSLLDTDRMPADSVAAVSHLKTPNADSLLPRSAEETRFVSRMQEREKFNIGFIASVAAEGTSMFPPAPEAVVVDSSRDEYSLRLMIPGKTVIMAPAEGTLIDAYFDNASRSNVVIIEHANGFLSRMSGLGPLLYGRNDRIAGGTALASSPAAKKGTLPEISVELWHNGIAVRPYGYFLFNPLPSQASPRRSGTKIK